MCVSDSVRLLAMVKWKRSPDGRTEEKQKQKQEEEEDKK